MISNDGATALKPHLLSMLKGIEIKESATVIPTLLMEYDVENDSFNVANETNTTSQYIAILAIKSPVFKYDQICGPIGTRSMTRILKEWQADDNVMGVVLDIDSPGGQVSGLAEFAAFLNTYKKPIVAYTDGLVASAAYYIAAACHYIVANEHADFIGSIGTMISYVDLDGIFEKEGGIVKDIYATGSTRKNEESRLMKDKGSDDLIIKNILDPARDNFVATMQKFRPSLNETVFDGAIYSPVESLPLNLIDELGTLQTAFDKIMVLSKEKLNKSKITTNMTTKSLPKVEAVLGLESPLALNENGSFLNEEQLDAIEANIGNLETTNSTLEKQVHDASAAHKTAIEDVQGKLTEASNSLTAITTSVDAIIAHAGLKNEGTLTEKLAAIESKAIAFGKTDGDISTSIIVDAGAGSDDLETLSVAGISIKEALDN